MPIIKKTLCALFFSRMVTRDPVAKESRCKESGRAEEELLYLEDSRTCEDWRLWVPCRWAAADLLLRKDRSGCRGSCAGPEEGGRKAALDQAAWRERGEDQTRSLEEQMASGALQDCGAMDGGLFAAGARLLPAPTCIITMIKQARGSTELWLIALSLPLCSVAGHEVCLLYLSVFVLSWRQCLGHLHSGTVYCPRRKMSGTRK